jgi:deoxyribodipyrimidine photo-lyase
VAHSIIWFRRDLRISDHPALNAAIAAGDEVVPVFILDPRQKQQSGANRLAYLSQSLRELDQSLGNSLHVMAGDEVTVLQDLLKRYGADQVHISEEFEPYGLARDRRVEEAGITLIRTGSPYAVAPGRVRKPSDGTPYRVYTPFYKAWLAHGWRDPAQTPTEIPTVTPRESDRLFPDAKVPNGVTLTPAGEEAAFERWAWFKENGLDRYDELRNEAGIDGTSKLGAHLSWGEIHPRTLLAELNQTQAHDTYRKELAWREFYGDVLHHNPHTAHDYYAPQFAAMKYDKPGDKFQAWCDGKTGYPFVDAAMRQLAREGWMHNRTRMVVASFLVKDLHLEWQLGADFFEEYLLDFDIASNAHGWQWTAGTGTDASPYYRVFNPIEQGKRFDENGDYIRKYVPELAHLSAKDIHEPWNVLDGYLHDYPMQIVDHAKERIESLARLEEIKARKADKPS